MADDAIHRKDHISNPLKFASSHGPARGSQEQIKQLKAQLVAAQQRNHDKRAQLQKLRQYQQKIDLEASLEKLSREKTAIENSLSLRRVSVQFKSQQLSAANQALSERIVLLQAEQANNNQALIEALRLLKSQIKSEQDAEQGSKLQISKLQEEVLLTKEAIEKIKFENCKKEATMKIEPNVIRKCKCVLFQERLLQQVQIRSS